MFRRLFLAYLILLVLALGTFGILSARWTRARTLDELARRLDAEAEVVAALVRAERSPSSLQAALKDLGERTDVRLTVIAPDGKVIADSHADPASMENHNARPEVQEARLRGHGSQVRRSDTVRYEMMYHALLLDSGTVVRSALPVTRVEEELGDLTRGIGVTFLLVGLAGAGLTFLVARWITRPLREIRRVTQAIAGGDFARRAPLVAADEIGSVAGAINRMAEELSLRLDRLRAESAKLEAVLSSLEDGVVALDNRGRILHHNGAAGRLLSLDGRSLGLALWEAVRLPGLEEMANTCLREGRAGSTGAEVGGRELALSLFPQGASSGCVLVARDVTEERRYDRLRKEFVANVSHELRTPLSVIGGYVETLRDGALRDEQHAPKFLESIEKNVQRLTALVSDLLELSRLESGGQLTHPRRVEVRALLEKVLDELRPLSDRKGQRLVSEIAPDVHTIVADPDLLERALRNLVDNAIKYTPEGGSVTLGARSLADSALFAVRDTGIGIPVDDQPRIFERFYRVDKSRSRDLGGTGLGLAIVKHIAQLHGGSVSVESKPGAGSLFTLRLPVRDS